MIMRNKKRGAAWVLALAMVFGLFAGLPGATVSAQIHTGAAGDNITWTFNTNTGAMQFTGTGAMWD